MIAKLPDSDEPGQQASAIWAVTLERLGRERECSPLDPEDGQVLIGIPRHQDDESLRIRAARIAGSSLAAAKP